MKGWRWRGGWKGEREKYRQDKEFGGMGKKVEVE